MPLEYRQPVAAGTKKAIEEAQGEACTQILAVLLARNPQAVILAHGALRHGADSAKAIRAAAQDYQTAAVTAELGAMVAPSSNNAIAQATQLALERSSGSVRRRSDPVLPDCALQPQRDQECVEALRRLLRPGVWYSPGFMPRAWRTLAANRPKGTFWEFAARRPDAIEVEQKHVRIIPQPPTHGQRVATPKGLAPARAPAPRQSEAPPSVAPALVQAVAPAPRLPGPHDVEWIQRLGDDRNLGRPRGTGVGDFAGAWQGWWGTWQGWWDIRQPCAPPGVGHMAGVVRQSAAPPVQPVAPAPGQLVAVRGRTSQ